LKPPNEKGGDKERKVMGDFVEESVFDSLCVQRGKFEERGVTGKKAMRQVEGQGCENVGKKKNEQRGCRGGGLEKPGPPQ